MSSTEASARRRAARVASGDLCSQPGCPNPRTTRGLCKTHYNRAGGYGPKNTEHSKARHRAKTHLRKAVGRYTDVTPEYERALRDKAKHCPLCRVALIKAPYLPTSKELDHMVPLGVGGTHTIGNVRIICRNCNVRRPKDGSDYVGPLTLWAQEPGFVPARQPHRKRREPQICDCGSDKRNDRCLDCQPVRTRQSDGKRAAELRADGMAWPQIAASLGFGQSGNAIRAAKLYGEPDLVALWPKRTCETCGADLHRAGRGRPRRWCDDARCREQAGKLASTPTPTSIPWPPPWFKPRASATPRSRMSCVDCGDPATRGSRCRECWVETTEVA